MCTVRGHRLQKSTTHNMFNCAICGIWNDNYLHLTDHVIRERNDTAIMKLYASQYHGSLPVPPTHMSTQ